MASTGKKSVAKKSEANVADGVRVGESPVPGVTLRHVLRRHTNTIMRMAWSPNGRYLASPSSDNTIRIWDSRNDQYEILYRGSEDGEFFAVAWSPKETELAAAGVNN